jgi:TM2 domain
MREKLLKLYRYTYITQPTLQSNQKMFWVGFFLGIFGFHRLFMGYKWWWLMFLTMGGIGVWSMLDIWKLYTRQLPMADGRELS